MVILLVALELKMLLTMDEVYVVQWSYCWLPLSLKTLFTVDKMHMLQLFILLVALIVNYAVDNGCCVCVWCIVGYGHGYKKVTMCKVVMVIKLIDEVCDTVVILLVVLRLKDAFGSG